MLVMKCDLEEQTLLHYSGQRALRYMYNVTSFNNALSEFRPASPYSEIVEITKLSALLFLVGSMLFPENASCQG